MLSKIISHPMNRATPIEEAIGSIIASTPTRIITMGHIIDGRTAARGLTVSRALTAPLFFFWCRWVEKYRRQVYATEWSSGNWQSLQRV
jgi:hypothetical protein